MKSRVKGDFHARFRENAMVKVHGVTQLWLSLERTYFGLCNCESKKQPQKLCNV